MDILEPFPPAKGQLKFLLVAINYFTKWIEACPLAKITTENNNGQAKAANKVILWEVKKRLGNAKRQWADELPSILWAYHCTPQSTTQETPYRLTYGADAMIPVEVGETSHQRRFQKRAKRSGVSNRPRLGRRAQRRSSNPQRSLQTPSFPKIQQVSAKSYLTKI
uniref:Uncharacterized protein n=1 Tax=Cajanus cajan TaxID=3821 RepID=A0A151SXV4_CAJCA|nr:hypothetical protein KK1_015056 [Cajanus cajan]